MYLGHASAYMALAFWIASSAASSVVRLTSATFDAVTQLQSPETDWFIAFHAPNCQYYKALEPTLSAVAKALPKQLRVGAVDGRQNADLKDRFYVRRTPTVYFFHNGRMYPFKGPQTVEYMTEYASGRFREIDRANLNFKRYQPVPPPVRQQTTLDDVNATSAADSSATSTTHHLAATSNMKSDL
ncbi:hypothetical protein SDRG_14158 [Saprolegnia diclina VS20]|uniref:Thioredoxin domain-containing protein n=1 Tax=Saprolegnia diclina (strain VS20) TaxID=1156394 RepID=T0PRF1_SAPDV|nr:hypothetical protein SDRG_14158 [Saprolegnia diclina VS20]EQC28064.1 hypothetical protein SDRG_14158 [Saprolegnia diclina VS20]|eukprot:XP_008618489.1 hypothetical protein SDRG_14158 [Saprolegnia diclina VS20]